MQVEKVLIPRVLWDGIRHGGVDICSILHCGIHCQAVTGLPGKAILWYSWPLRAGNATFIDNRVDVSAGWQELCKTWVYLDCTNRLRSPCALPPLPAPRLRLIISFHRLSHMLSLIHRHQTHALHARCLSFKTLPIIVPQPLQRSPRRTPQIRQIGHIPVRSFMPNIDEQSGQAEFLRLGVH